MRVTCSRQAIAYVPETSPEHTHEGLNLQPGVDLRIGDPIPGGDTSAILVPIGCGHAFDIEDKPWLWDVNTEVDDVGDEWVVERHLAVCCPRCGVTADHLSIPTERYQFMHQGLSKRERIILGDPAILELLDGVPEERRIRLLEVMRRGIAGGADVGYAHVTEGAVALAATTAKTIIGAKAGSAAGLNWCYWEVSFDGVTASAVPVLVELCYCTWASNAPGTNSTGTTERQEYGRVLAADWTGGRNWTTEPTVLTVNTEMLLTPNGGLIIYDDPLGTEPDCALGEGFGIRCTAPAIVNVRATQKLKRI